MKKGSHIDLQAFLFVSSIRCFGWDQVTKEGANKLEEIERKFQSVRVVIAMMKPCKERIRVNSSSLSFP
jgi:hypothetical protein